MIIDEIVYLLIFFKQKTAYEVRIRDWSSDVCSSDLGWTRKIMRSLARSSRWSPVSANICSTSRRGSSACPNALRALCTDCTRSEEHTSELQSLMRISYAVFCLKKKKNSLQHTHSSILYTLTM